MRSCVVADYSCPIIFLGADFSPIATARPAKACDCRGSFVATTLKCPATSLAGFCWRPKIDAAGDEYGDGSCLYSGCINSISLSYDRTAVPTRMDRTMDEVRAPKREVRLSSSAKPFGFVSFLSHSRRANITQSRAVPFLSSLLLRAGRVRHRCVQDCPRDGVPPVDADERADDLEGEAPPRGHSAPHN